MHVFHNVVLGNCSICLTVSAHQSMERGIAENGRLKIRAENSRLKIKRAVGQSRKRCFAMTGLMSQLQHHRLTTWALIVTVHDA